MYNRNPTEVDIKKSVNHLFSDSRGFNVYTRNPTITANIKVNTAAIILIKLFISIFIKYLSFTRNLFRAL